MNPVSQTPKIRYIAVGSLGEEPIVQALTDVPSVEIKQITLPGYGLRMQPLSQVRQDFVRNDLKSAWDERGTPFYGAMTLVKAEGEQAQVSMVELTLDQWKKALKRLKFWNYHDYQNKEEGWFRFQTVQINTPDGQITCLVETLPEGTALSPVPENYREDPAYQSFIKAMEEGVYAYRAREEGSPSGKEK